MFYGSVFSVFVEILAIYDQAQSLSLNLQLNKIYYRIRLFSTIGSEIFVLAEIQAINDQDPNLSVTLKEKPRFYVAFVNFLQFNSTFILENFTKGSLVQ